MENEQHKRIIYDAFMQHLQALYPLEHLKIQSGNSNVAETEALLEDFVNSIKSNQTKK